FTLRDLVSYEDKHNEANGEANRDGDSDNNSSNGGVEGETVKPTILQRRRRRARSLLATLFCARGVPFLTAGDERWRTQRGNNNAYCQDNDISWIDWKPDPTTEDLRSYVKNLIQLRRHLPELRQPNFYTGREDPLTGLADVTWLDGEGGVLSSEQWHQSDREHFGM
ncbi:MAG: glycogen debranching enzyme GlgX, partial [Planctomycetales bacterium]|nr:glycogen debranching enzyme GlgX [Planctomycetales bacterium]